MVDPPSRNNSIISVAAIPTAPAQATRYEILCQPFFLVVALGLNLPPVIFGVQTFVEWCNYYSSWLVGNACMTILNMVAALYAVYKIRKTAQSVDEEMPSRSVHSTNRNNNNNTDQQQQQQQQRQQQASEEDHSTDKEDEDDDDENDDHDEERGTQASVELTPDQSLPQEEEGKEPERVGPVVNTSNNVTTTTIQQGPARRQKKKKKGCFSRLAAWRTTSSDRIRHLICYDGVTATYAILFIFWVFWLSEGHQRRKAFDDVVAEQQLVMEQQQQLALDGDETPVTAGCQDLHEDYLQWSLICGFSYFAFVIISLLCSVCFRR